MSQRVSIVDLGSGHVEGFAHDVPHVAESGVADGHLEAVTGVDHFGAAGQTVGRLHGDGTNPVVTDLLRHLARHDNIFAVDGDRHRQLHVDLGQVAGRELHVDNWSSDADDSACFQFWFGDGHTDTPSVYSIAGDSSPPSPPRASAPLTISMISVVIEA